MERKKFVIIMAAGSGTRMGAGSPKQFLELGGKAILQRTIEVFQEACRDISVITVLPFHMLSTVFTKIIRVSEKLSSVIGRFFVILHANFTNRKK